MTIFSMTSAFVQKLAWNDKCLHVQKTLQASKEKAWIQNYAQSKLHITRLGLKSPNSSKTTVDVKTHVAQHKAKTQLFFYVGLFLIIW